MMEVHVGRYVGRRARWRLSLDCSGPRCCEMEGRGKIARAGLVMRVRGEKREVGLVLCWREEGRLVVEEDRRLQSRTA